MIKLAMCPIFKYSIVNLGLENMAEYQNERNRHVDSTLQEMDDEATNLENVLKDLIREATENLDLEIRQMKQEVDHRFDLQDAENKRLQQHVATLKAENNQLTRKLVSK